MGQDRTEGARRRRLVRARVATTYVGTAWFVATLLPLTEEGPLSRSSSLDVARLVRTGALDALLDPRLVPVLLLLPSLGLLLVALSCVPGAVPAAVRSITLGLGAVGASAVVLIVSILGGGWGAATYVLACSVPVAVATPLVGRRRAVTPLAMSGPDRAAAPSPLPTSPLPTSFEEIPR